MCRRDRVGREVGRYTLARTILAGNGSLLATCDRFGSLRELYAPFVSPEHQILRRPARIAVAVDGAVHWVEDRFESRIGEGGDAPIADLALVSEDLGLELWIEIVADANRNVLIRRVQLTNRSGSHRDARLLFHHDLRLASAAGEPRETAAFDPVSGALLHQAARRVAMIGLETSAGPGVPLWKVAARGTDLEPGAESLGPGARLEGPSEAYGRTDSLVGAPMTLAPGASSLVSVWIGMSDSVRGARDMEESLRRSGVGAALGATRAHWNLWIGQGARDLPDLPEDVQTLYHRSLALVRLHQMPGGAIVSAVEPFDAGSDPDSGLPARPDPRVCRHRDAAQAADALGRAGYPAHTRRYLEHALRASREHGTLPSETDASGAPGVARPDPAGTALSIWALARHFERERDAEFLGDAYRGLVTPNAETLASALDPDTQLPVGMDLWGEREGVFASNASAVRAGLLAAARLAAALGESARARAWAGASDRIARSMTRHLLLPEWGRFARSVAREGRATRADATVDASLLTLGLWGEMEAEDARVRATVESVRETLWVRTGTGGVARYERDPLYSVGTELAEVPGSPSVMATLWLASHAIRVARKTQDLDAARTLLLWCAARAEGWSGLPEQLHPYRGETRSACPSLLAHTWLVATVADYVERLRLLKRCDRCGAPASSGRGRRSLALPDSLAPGLVAHAQR